MKQAAKRAVRTALFVLAAIGPSASMAAEGDTPALPWQMAGNNHVLVGVVWNEAVLKLIPKGLTAVAERTGGINIYNSPRGYGASPSRQHAVHPPAGGMASASHGCNLASRATVTARSQTDGCPAAPPKCRPSCSRPSSA